ncbi:unnamed protein product [Caenorhabditis brenneri]
MASTHCQGKMSGASDARTYGDRPRRTAALRESTGKPQCQLNSTIKEERIMNRPLKVPRPKLTHSFSLSSNKWNEIESSLDQLSRLRSHG